jgi:hypothetical protein
VGGRLGCRRRRDRECALVTGFVREYRTEELHYRVWWYEPDERAPLTWVDGDERITIDRKFETDGATIPRFPWRVLPGFDPWDWPRAALLHDWLYEMKKLGTPVCGFFGANRRLYKAVRWYGFNVLTCAFVWLAVTLFGWYWWFSGESSIQEAAE